MRLLQAKTESTHADFTYSIVGNVNGESVAAKQIDMIDDPATKDELYLPMSCCGFGSMRGKV
jgi:hypothetical protein